MSLEFKPQKRIFEFFEPDFDNIILTTFEFDQGFIEDRLLPVLTGKKAVKNINDRLEVEDALKDKSISIITSKNIKEKRTLLGYDLIPYNGVQHSKIAVLARRNLVRIIVGSINLTENAFYKNLEAFFVLDFKENSDLPNFLALDILNYLINISGNHSKIIEQIDEIKNCLNSIKLNSKWKRSGITIKFLTYPNPNNSFIVEQLFNEINKEKIKKLKILTPFFEQKSSSFFNYFMEKSSQKEVQNIGIFFPSISEASGDDTMWQIQADESMLKQAKKYNHLVQFYPISNTEVTSNRNLHAKLIYINSDKANYLVIGSSNFTKKGLGFKGVWPNAEANLLIRTPNPNERKLKEFFPSNIQEQEIEFLKPIPPAPDGEENIDDLLLPQILRRAEYEDEKLTIEFTDECYNSTDRWSIFLADEIILKEDDWNKDRIFEKKISLSNMAKKAIDIEIKMNSGFYYFPIVFNDINQLIAESHKNISIDPDSLILYWLNRITRPNASDKTKRKKDESRSSKPTKPIETPDLLMSKVKMFIKALDGVREYLQEDKIASPKMLENRTYGIFGIDKIFNNVNDLDDKLTKLFCYSEMVLVINDIIFGYKDDNKKKILEDYKQILKEKITEFKNMDLQKEWQIYLRHTKV